MKINNNVFVIVLWGCLFFGISVVHAAGNSALLPIYGNACEKIKKDEPRSSARVRVTDMACYAAAESIPEIQGLKNKLGEHDFSVLVYNIVDNYLESLAIKTLIEDGREICLEVTGGITPENLKMVWENAENTIKATETQNLNHQDNSEVAQIQDPTPVQLITPAGGDKFTAVKIYFMPTHFYNDTQSNNLANVLKEFFINKPNIKIAEDRKNADYVVHSEVLRAKIDQVNEEKSRLHMVISLELRDKDGKSIITEHQNRFVLFAVDDNEQEIAFRLLKKLFKNAAQLLYKRVERESGLENQI